MGSNVTPIGIIEAADEEQCVPLPLITEIIPATEAINALHNNLEGLQGGKVGERFHLTYAQYQVLDHLEDFPDSALFVHKAGYETITGYKNFIAGMQVSGPSTYITASDTNAQLLLSADSNVDVTGGKYITLGSPKLIMNLGLEEVFGDQQILVRKDNNEMAFIRAVKPQIFLSTDFTGDGKAEETKIFLNREVILEHLRGLPGYGPNKVLSDAMVWVVPYGYDDGSTSGSEPIVAGALIDNTIINDNTILN